MKMVNVTQMQIKMEIVNAVAKCRWSVTCKSDLVLLSICFPISFLNSACDFPRAFTSSAFAITFAFESVENVTSLFSFLTFLSLLSLLLSLFEFLSLLSLCVFRFNFCSLCSFCFHSFFLKNGFPYEEKLSVLWWVFPFRLCWRSIYVETVLVTKAIIGSFLSFSDGVRYSSAILSDRFVFCWRICATLSPRILFLLCFVGT